MEGTLSFRHQASPFAERHAAWGRESEEARNLGLSLWAVPTWGTGQRVQSEILKHTAKVFLFSVVFERY